MYRIRQQATKKAVMMFKRDRRREIDAVIDYFGESPEAHAARPRAVPGKPSRYIISNSRFAWAAGNETLGFPEG